MSTWRRSPKGWGPLRTPLNRKSPPTSSLLLVSESTLLSPWAWKAGADKATLTQKRKQSGVHTCAALHCSCTSRRRKHQPEQTIPLPCSFEAKASQAQWRKEPAGLLQMRMAQLTSSPQSTDIQLKGCIRSHGREGCHLVDEKAQHQQRRRW